MAKPTALRLAQDALRDAPVVDVRRRDGDWWIDTHIDQPGFSAGRYVLMPVEDMELVLKRLVVVEQAQLLAKAQQRASRKQSGRHSLKRR